MQAKEWRENQMQCYETHLPMTKPTNLATIYPPCTHPARSTASGCMHGAQESRRGARERSIPPHTSPRIPHCCCRVCHGRCGWPARYFSSGKTPSQGRPSCSWRDRRGRQPLWRTSPGIGQGWLRRTVRDWLRSPAGAPSLSWTAYRQSAYRPSHGSEEGRHQLLEMLRRRRLVQLFPRMLLLRLLWLLLVRMISGKLPDRFQLHHLLMFQDSWRRPSQIDPPVDYIITIVGGYSPTNGKKFHK